MSGAGSLSPEDGSVQEENVATTTDQKIVQFFRDFAIPLPRVPHFLQRLEDDLNVDIPPQLRNACASLPAVSPTKGGKANSRKRTSGANNGYEQGSSSSVSKRTTRKNMAADEKRLKEVEKELQKRLDEISNQHRDSSQFRMEIGEGVLVLSHGYYYECQIISRGSGKIKDGQKSPNQYSVRFHGWSKRYDSLVEENYLIMRKTKEGFANIFGMLFAHEWNFFHYASAGLDEKELGKGFWLLDSEIYADLENTWRRETKNTITFAEYCGTNQDRT